MGLLQKTGQKSHTDDMDAKALLATAGVIGPSPRIKDVIRQIEIAARSTAGITIVGEAGTDGDLVARAIHATGRPPEAPFVVIQGDGSSPSRIELDLFGNSDAGAAPAAVPDRIAAGSLLHRARGGTIFFSHIEELPDRVQVRLAQVLRDGEVLVGAGDRAERLDVWPMAVVGPDFQNEIEEGRVRTPLANRFGGTRIFVPPLRERREDIPHLAQYYLDRISLTAGTAPRDISQPALALLSALEWNGNGRELRTLMETITANGSQGEVGLDAVIEQLQRKGNSISRGLNMPVGATLRQARQQFEREFITAVLAQHHGRIPDTARSLGIQRTNLYRKMRSLRLTPAPARPKYD
jgi:two-component system nitrogen regulation response regulator NtrX